MLSLKKAIIESEYSGISRKYSIRIRKINVLELLADLSVFVMIFSIFTSTSIPIANVTLVYFVSINILFSKKKIYLKAPYNIWSFMILILYTLAYWIFSNNYNAFEVYFTYARTLIIAVFIYNYIRSNPKNLKKTIDFCTLSGVYLIIKFFFENNLGSLALFSTTESEYTIQGINRNSIAINLSITALFLWYWARSGKKWAYLLFAIGAIEAFITGSRKSIIWITAGLALYIFLEGWIDLKKRKSILKLGGNVLSISLMLVGFYFLVMKLPMLYEILGQRIEGLIYLFTGKGTPEMSAQIRNNMNQIAVSMFFDRPIFGGGFNYFATYSGWGVYSHNNYLETLVSFGFIGFILYYSMHLYLILNFLKKKHILINSLSHSMYSIIFVSILLTVIIDMAMISVDTKHFSIILSMGAAALDLSIQKSRLLE